MRIQIGYPTQTEENAILSRFRAEDPLEKLQPVTSPAEIIQMQQQRREIRVEDSLRDYIVRIARATRNNQDIQLGASPRASMALYQSGQAWAAIHGRDFVLPDDIKYLAASVLCHRLIISAQAQLRGRSAVELVNDIVSAVPVPVES
jgi:MoxR-like ATPase